MAGDLLSADADDARAVFDIPVVGLLAAVKYALRDLEAANGALRDDLEISNGDGIASNAGLFSEEEPRVYPAQPVRFGCTCGPEKVVRTLAPYSPSEIAGMTTPEGKVTADCQFCGAHYEFDPSELGSGAAAAE